MFNGTIQTILVGFSMKTHRACTGMLSSENDDFKFLKTTKNRKSKCITFTIVPGLVELFYLSTTAIFQVYMLSYLESLEVKFLD